MNKGTVIPSTGIFYNRFLVESKAWRRWLCVSLGVGEVEEIPTGIGKSCPGVVTRARQRGAPYLTTFNGCMARHVAVGATAIVALPVVGIPFCCDAAFV
jgi:hypothetical protein